MLKFPSPGELWVGLVASKEGSGLARSRKRAEKGQGRLENTWNRFCLQDPSHGGQNEPQEAPGEPTHREGEERAEPHLDLEEPRAGGTDGC